MKKFFFWLLAAPVLFSTDLNHGKEVMLDDFSGKKPWKSGIHAGGPYGESGGDLNLHVKGGHGYFSWKNEDHGTQGAKLDLSPRPKAVAGDTIKLEAWNASDFDVWFKPVILARSKTPVSGGFQLNYEAFETEEDYIRLKAGEDVRELAVVLKDPELMEGSDMDDEIFAIYLHVRDEPAYGSGESYDGNPEGPIEIAFDDIRLVKQ